MFSKLINNLLSIRYEFSDEFVALETVISDFLHTNVMFSSLEAFILNRGKRIRSILYFLIWNKCATISDDIKYKTIAFIELIHFASMLHDDVIDNNMTRRNGGSFLKEYGAKKSILIGDLLLVDAIDNLLRIHSDNEFVRNFIIKQCSNTACGAVLERELNYTSPAQDCVNVIALKTGSLFELVCVLSSLLSGKTCLDEVSKFGKYFGLLFQYQNDVNSFSSPNCQHSEDFMQGNVTLPLVLIRDFFHISLSTILDGRQSSYGFARNLLNSPEFQDFALNYLRNFNCFVSDFLYSLHPNSSPQS